ncbi:MAG: hypothetical protein V3V95_07985 [Thermodesulfobacteriota bacterium]
MKRFLLFSLVAVFVLISTSAMAYDPYKLGGKASFKAGWLLFTDDFLEDTDSDQALYLAVEAKSRLTDYLDVGMEIGYTQFKGDIVGPKEISGKGSNFLGTIENEITYVPIELNISHTKDFGTLAYTLGVGVSLNYINWDINVNDTGTPFTLVDEEDNWVAGAQAYFGFAFEGEEYFVGLDGKYQYVQEQNFFNDWLEINFNNWRTSIQVGRFF